jgi:hypothetical protein
MSFLHDQSSAQACSEWLAPGRPQRRMDGVTTRRHSPGMEVGYVSALSALAGSFVGGLTSGVATWLSQRAQVRAGRLEHELSRRGQLYKEFIVAASKAYGDAMVSNEPQVPAMVDLYAMISVMRVVSAPQTLATAEKVMDETIQAYFEPNRTVRELHDSVLKGKGIDPLKDFSEAARAELQRFTPR